MTRSIDRLYTHQAEAFSHASAGRNVVIVTPTASGKTLCYNLPVLNGLLADPNARAMYLFPTKALAEDQLQPGIPVENAAEHETYRLGCGFDGETHHGFVNGADLFDVEGAVGDAGVLGGGGKTWTAEAPAPAVSWSA